jgi:hypothetical protein
VRYARRPLHRKPWLFAGSDSGGEKAAFMYTLIVTAKVTGIDPESGSSMPSLVSPICHRTGFASSCPGP